MDEPELQQNVEQALSKGDVVALSLDVGGVAGRLLAELATKQTAPLLPVWYEAAPRSENNRRQRVYILAGRLLPAGSAMAEVERELQRLAEEFKELADRGEPLKHTEFVRH